MVKLQAEVTSTYDIEDGLIQDGIKASDAKAIVKALIKLQIGTVATKTDVLELKHDISKLEHDISKLENDISKLEHEVKTDISKLEHDISKLEHEVKNDISKLEHEVKTNISKLEYKIENAIHKNNRFLLGSITAIGSLILVASKILDKII